MEIFLAGISGLLLGYLINYLSDVLPATRSFSAPACVHCQQRISWRDYLAFRNCQSCGSRRTARAWIVQTAFFAASLWMAISPPVKLGLWAGIGVLAFLALVAVIDIEHRLVLHPVSWAGLALGLGVGLWQQGLWPTLLGGAAGYVIMFALYGLGILFNRWMARRRHQEIEEVALGFGDVNVTGFLGLMVGWPEIVGVLILAIFLGGVISGLMMAAMLLRKNYQPLTAIPYAPFLLIGAIIFLYIPK